MALSKQEQQYQNIEVIHNHHLRTVNRETTEGLNVFYFTKPTKWLQISEKEPKPNSSFNKR